MAVRNPRSRLISFRLSEGEYRALQDVCDAQEARSLSDFVRTMIRWIASNADQLPSDLLGGYTAEGLIGPVADNGETKQDSGGNGWELRLTKELVHLSRRTDALDREIRRLSLLLAKQ